MATAGGEIVVLNHAGAAARFAGTTLPVGWQDAPCAIALGVRAPDRGLVRSFLEGNGVPFAIAGETLRVGPPHPGNIVLEFQP